MRIQVGHGRNTLGKNIKEFMEIDGYSEKEAESKAKKIARKHFAKKFPDKDMPEYMMEVGEDV